MIDTRIIKVEIVKGMASPIEIKVYHGDGTWQYFSRGFSTIESAKETAKRLSKKVTVIE